MKTLMQTSLSAGFILKPQISNLCGEVAIHIIIREGGDRAVECATGLYVCRKVWKELKADPNSKNEKVINLRKTLRELMAKIFSEVNIPYHQ